MPFKSKAQMRLFFAKEKRGELPKGEAAKWARETKDIKHLPEHVKKASLTLEGFIAELAKNAGAVKALMMFKPTRMAKRITSTTKAVTTPRGMIKQK